MDHNHQGGVNNLIGGNSHYRGGHHGPDTNQNGNGVMNGAGYTGEHGRMSSGFGAYGVNNGQSDNYAGYAQYNDMQYGGGSQQQYNGMQQVSHGYNMGSNQISYAGLPNNYGGGPGGLMRNGGNNVYNQEDEIQGYQQYVGQANIGNDDEPGQIDTSYTNMNNVSQYSSNNYSQQKYPTRHQQQRMQQQRYNQKMQMNNGDLNQDQIVGQQYGQESGIAQGSNYDFNNQQQIAGYQEMNEDQKSPFVMNDNRQNPDYITNRHQMMGSPASRHYFGSQRATPNAQRMNDPRRSTENRRKMDSAGEIQVYGSASAGLNQGNQFNQYGQVNSTAYNYKNQSSQSMSGMPTHLQSSQLTPRHQVENQSNHNINNYGQRNYQPALETIYSTQNLRQNQQQINQYNNNNQYQQQKQQQNKQVSKKSARPSKKEKKEAGEKIAQAMVINKQVREAIKARILAESIRSQIIIARAINNFKNLRNARYKRHQGIYRATLYMEPKQGENIKSRYTVEVFGEFTEDRPWQVKIPCVYDQEFGCHKADVDIRIGQLFKFILDNGRKYVVSNRYYVQRDHSGNENNVFDPKRIKWSQNERKKNRSGLNLYNVPVQKKQHIMKKQISSYENPALQALSPQKLYQNTNSKKMLSIDQQKQKFSVESQRAPKVTKNTEIISLVETNSQSHDDIFNFGQNSQKAIGATGYYGQDPKQNNYDIQSQNRLQEKSRNQSRAYQNSVDNDMYRGMSEGLKANRSSYAQEQEFNRAVTPSHQSDRIVSTSGNQFKAIYEPSHEQISLNQDFRYRFDEFFGDDKKGTGFRNGVNQSGSHAFNYNEEDEFFQNLMNSGNFQNVSEYLFKDNRKGRYTQKSNVQPLKQVNIPPQLQVEIDQCKPYENVFDLFFIDNDGVSQDLQFNQLTLDSMHQRSTATPKAKRKSTTVTAQPQAKRATPKNRLNSFRRNTPQSSGNKYQGSAASGSNQRRTSVNNRNLNTSNNKSVSNTTFDQNQGTASHVVQIEKSPIGSDQKKKQDSDANRPTTPAKQIPDQGHQKEVGLGHKRKMSENKNDNKIKQVTNVTLDGSDINKQGHHNVETGGSTQLSDPVNETGGEQGIASTSDLELDKKEDTKINQQVRSVPALNLNQSPVRNVNIDKDINSEERPKLDQSPVPKIKSTPMPEIQPHNLSEISFFYENGEEEGFEETEDLKNAPFILISGAHCIGKQPNQCEDSYFISDRAFGVSDGVSGWNDYGFSSDQFSLQLMNNAQKQIEQSISQGIRNKKKGKGSRTSRSSTAMRKNRSFLSMDNLDIEEESQEEDQTNSVDDPSMISGANSIGGKSESTTRRKLRRGKDGYDSEDSKYVRGNKPMHSADRTADHKKEIDMSQQEQKLMTPMTLQEEIRKKLDTKKITQQEINQFYRSRMDKTGNLSPTRQMIMDENRYDVCLFPTYILEKAFRKVNAVGSATALIAIQNKNELCIANIGDSGFLVIRFKGGEPYCPHKSKEQQHAFNIPYQLSQLPSQADLEILRQKGKLTEMAKLKNVLKKKNNVCQDQPDNADEYQVELKDGDIVVSATDGVFDNLFQHEILTMVTDYKRKQEGNALTSEKQAQELAQIIVETAIDKFKNPKGKKTPYQRKYKKTYNATWEGGKEDDITVLISVARRVRKLTGTGSRPGSKQQQATIFTEEAMKEIHQT